MTAPSSSPDDYLPIEDHGAIGNLRSVALVGRDGAIDWCCLPRLQSASVFASLLDHHRGGRFALRPTDGPRLGAQAYLEHTNVLVTTFDTDGGGQLEVTDLMPLRGSIVGRCGSSETEPAVLRLARARGGSVEVALEWTPRFDYGGSSTRLAATDHGHLAWAGEDALTLCGLTPDDHLEVLDLHNGPSLRARFTLGDGERRVIASRWGTEEFGLDVDEAMAWVDSTVTTWRSWVHAADAATSRDWAAPYQELVIRSELVLKLLTVADTGAIAAAATTSLPEEIGGVRNWDYRYAWIRDAALSAQALFALGHRDEASAFIEWVEQVARTEGRREWGLQLVYGLDGGTEMPESDLPGLEGYRRSAPVRIGNGAVDQLQLDIYGELISAAYELVRNGEALSDETRAFLPEVADEACRNWHEADYGLWEVRNGPRQFVYSKAMVWMALDRAVRLAERGVIDGAVDRWRATCVAIREEVLERGFDDELGSFVQSYDRPVLDASNALLPMMEFLPFDDPRSQRTVKSTYEGLTDADLVWRYHADDGVAGGEGGFGLCTFWLVDALAMSEQVDEARRLFESMAARANHVGLYSEQIDPRDGSFLGNFPQAFTHIGLINSALYLAYVEGRPSPVGAPIGSDEHRAERAGEPGAAP